MDNLYSTDNLPEHIRLVRQACDFTQARLARALAVNPSLISGWELGANHPCCINLIELVNICGVSLASMFTDPRFSRDRYSADAFRANLALHRQRHGLRQKDVATQTGVAEPLISLYEHGRKTPGVANIARIANGLNIDIDWLFRQEDATHGHVNQTTAARESRIA